MQTFADLQRQFPKTGQLVWIGIRPNKRQTLLEPVTAMLDSEMGLIGDHYSGRSKKRQLTLFQQEHIHVLSSFLGKPIDPAMLRRNLLIQGINLLALKNRTFKVGEAVLAMTGLCHPCSRMETIFGVGGYNAMRYHGGITAQVISSGRIQIGDALTVIND